MPRKHVSYLPVISPNKKSTISQYFVTISCAICGDQTKDGICEICSNDSQNSTLILQNKVMIWEKNYYQTKLVSNNVYLTLKILM